MKRTFLTNRNALFSSTTVSWGGYALIFAISVALLRLVAPTFFWQVFSPVFHLSSRVSSESRAYIAGVVNAAALARENERLRGENAALVLENKTLLLAAASEAALGERLSERDIVAGVVARPPESPYDTLVLGAGSRAGVSLGMGAFGPGGSPVGVVTQVLPEFSRATLFSSAGMKLAAWAGSANVPLTLTGTGGGTMSAAVSRSAGIVEGDTVAAPGPGPLPMGSVVRVDSDPASPAVTLRIRPLVNPFSLTTVILRDTGRAFEAAVVSATTTP